MGVLGFHEPTRMDRIRVTRHGDPDWWIRVRPRPTPQHPHQAVVATHTARATWANPAHAALWANHPGAAPVMVRHYLAWTRGEHCPGTSTCTCEETTDAPTLW